MNPATDYDLGLVRPVFEERIPGGKIAAALTRWGGLAVFVYLDSTPFPSTEFPVWQGDNILEARAWAAQQQEKAA